MFKSLEEKLLQKSEDAKTNWMDNWDECIGKVDENGDIFISKKTIESETFRISKEELLEARNEFQTPADWVYENINSYHCCDADREGETFEIS